MGMCVAHIEKKNKPSVSVCLCVWASCIVSFSIMDVGFGAVCVWHTPNQPTTHFLLGRVNACLHSSEFATAKH